MPLTDDGMFCECFFFFKEMLVSLILICHEGEASNLSVKVCRHLNEETPEMRSETKGNDVIRHF